jgi:hypothetical protein
MTAPYCTAPFHGALIETDKTVRPYKFVDLVPEAQD